MIGIYALLYIGHTNLLYTSNASLLYVGNIGTHMPLWQQVAMVAAGVLATMLTRFIPFMVFRPGKPTPKYIMYLGKVLPASVFALLVMYCLKNISFIASDTVSAESLTFGIPTDTIAQLLGVAFTILIHAWRKSMMWSIAAGTIFYMILIRIL